MTLFLTLMVLLLLRGIYLGFFLNLYCSVVFLIIPSSIFMPTCCAQSQFTVASAVIPEAILFSVEFPPKGLLGVRYSRTSSVSAMSLSCRAFETSLCWSIVVYDTLVSSCTAFNTSHKRRCDSVISLPRVRPPVVLRLRIKTCSIIMSADNPVQYLPLLLNT